VELVGEDPHCLADSLEAHPGVEQALDHIGNGALGWNGDNEYMPGAAR
jgi:hypothetical protein